MTHELKQLIIMVSGKYGAIVAARWQKQLHHTLAYWF